MSTTTKIRLRRIGNSVGTAVPGDVQDRLELEAKGRLHLAETEGGLALKRPDQDYLDMMEAYHAIAKKYEGVFRELAK